MSYSNIKVQEIAIGDIEVGERFRKDLGDISALADSIRKDGLIQPIAVCNNEGEVPFRLIAGGRRFSAILHIAQKNGGKKTVSCRIYEDAMPEIQLRVLEFAENLYRKDMTWQEECNLKEHIHDLQQRIHGIKTSTAPNATGWSLTDLSKMTGKSKGSLSGDISMAKIMKDTPSIDWDKFSTKHDAQKAMKHAKKIVTQTIEAKVAKETIGTGDSLKKKLIDSYHIKDFLKGVKKIGDSTMDFIEIDPPYGIDLEKQKKDYNYSGYNEVPVDMYKPFMQNVFKESFRVLKPNKWMICWFGPEPWFESIHNWIIEAGFKNRRMPAMWLKGEPDENMQTTISAQNKQPSRSLANGYEMFFMAKKGIPELEIPGAVNVFGHKPIPGQHKVHPTERPIPLITDILTTFTSAGSNVLVPFAGSGNTLIAAAKSNMVPVGFDLTEEFFESYIIKIHKMF